MDPYWQVRFHTADGVAWAEGEGFSLEPARVGSLTASGVEAWWVDKAVEGSQTGSLGEPPISRVVRVDPAPAGGDLVFYQYIEAW